MESQIIVETRLQVYMYHNHLHMPEDQQLAPFPGGLFYCLWNQNNVSSREKWKQGSIYKNKEK